MKSRLTILSVVGARPQLIKLAPLVKPFSERFKHLIIHTGQHYDQNMSDIFFRQLRLPRADVNLNIRGGSHGRMTGRMLTAIEKQLQEKRPDMVLVYGDTNSTLAGALAAAKLAIPVGHIEAGLRSHVDDMPEEINRRMTDHLSRLLFCPTAEAFRNLKAEGIKKKVVRSGDVMYELLDSSLGLIKGNRAIIERLGLKPTGYVVLTLHRAANVDSRENLLKIIQILRGIEGPVLFPIHPRTSARFRKFGLTKQLRSIDQLIVTQPLSYLDILSAVFYSRAVLTDSGGLQKESLFLGRPVATLREETEWPETLRYGNCLVGLNRNRVRRFLRNLPKVRKIEFRWRGMKPSKIISDEIANFLRRN